MLQFMYYYDVIMYSLEFLHPSWILHAWGTYIGRMMHEIASTQPHMHARTHKHMHAHTYTNTHTHNKALSYNVHHITNRFENIPCAAQSRATSSLCEQSCLPIPSLSQLFIATSNDEQSTLSNQTGVKIEAELYLRETKANINGHGFVVELLCMCKCHYEHQLNREIANNC